MGKPVTKARAGARASIIAAIAVAVVVAVAVAHAAIPTTGGNLPACAINETGILRMLDADERCTTEETEIQIASADAEGRVADAQLLDGNDSSAFLQTGTAAGGSLSGAYPDPALRANAVLGNHLNDLTFSDGDLTPSFSGSLKSFQIPNGAIQGPEIEDETVTAVDIDEATLPSLDGHDAFRPRCDPENSGYVLCAAVPFTAGRAMPVLMTVAYSLYRESFGPGFTQGACKTRLDGVDQGTVANGDVGPGYPPFPDAGVPIVDVIPVSAGAHSLEFLCCQDSALDLVFGDIRLAVVELGMD
jgi:hypothetical protein